MSTDIRPLTAARKADRAEMARQVADLARAYGITAGEPHQGIFGPRHLAVDLKGPHGIALTVNFDGSPGGTAPDVYVLSWHLSLRAMDDGVRLHWGMFGNVNSHHGHKATDVAHGFEQLLRTLRERFEVIRSDSAFIVAR